MTRERIKEIKSKAALLLLEHEYNKRFIPIDIREMLEATVQLADEMKNVTD